MTVRIESGAEADSRRLNVLLRNDGTVLVPPRLAPWVKSLIQADLARRRRNGREGTPAYDVLTLIDALSNAPQDIAVNGNDVMRIDKMRTGDVPGVNDPASTREAATELECSVRTVRWMLANGRLAGRKSGRAWLVDRSSLLEYMNGKAA